MSHEDDDSAAIILSIAVPPDVADYLNCLVGLDGATREEVASLHLCRAFGKKPPHKHK